MNIKDFFEGGRVELPASFAHQRICVNLTREIATDHLYASLSAADEAPISVIAKVGPDGELTVVKGEEVDLDAILEMVLTIRKQPRA